MKFCNDPNLSNLLVCNGLSSSFLALPILRPLSLDLCKKGEVVAVVAEDCQGISGRWFESSTRDIFVRTWRSKLPGISCFSRPYFAASAVVNFIRPVFLFLFLSDFVSLYVTLSLLLSDFLSNFVCISVCLFLSVYLYYSLIFSLSV